MVALQLDPIGLWPKAGVALTALQRILALSPSALWWPANGSGWQGTSGGTLSASGQPVGLLPDLSQLGGKTLAEWLASAAELVTNGGFDSDATGWTAYGASLPTLSAPSGELVVTNTGTTAGRGASQAITTVIGRAYVVQFTFVSTTGTAAQRLRAGTTIGGADNANINFGSAGTHTVIFTATATTTYISLHDQGVSATSTLTWDNISVRELPGNHLRAGTWASPSDAARGTFQNNAINFNGSAHYYSLLNAISITESMTVVRAFKRASAGIISQGLATPAGGEAYESIWIADNITYARLGTTEINSGSASTSTGSFVDTVRRAASTQTIRRNGTQIASGSASAVSGNLSTLGRRNTTYNSGEISFLAVFPTELTGADLALVEQIAAGTNGAVLT